MADVDACELRLLRCALCQRAGKLNWVRTETPLEEALVQAVELIEQGLFSDVAAMDVMRQIFGDINALLTDVDNPEAAAKTFYELVRNNVQGFVDGNGGSAASVLLVLAAGVAFLFVFLQSNFTGPQKKFPGFPLDVMCSPGVWTLTTQRAWDTWARSQLMVDGCDVKGKCACPQYLILANALFRVLKCRNEPSTRPWWASRALFSQQKILEERSPTLMKEITAGYSAAVKTFGTKFIKGSRGWYAGLVEGEEDTIAASSLIEASLVEYHYGHAEEARVYVDQAEKLVGLKYSVQGAMGYRRQHQVDPFAQWVLKDESGLEANIERADKSSNTDVLLVPKLEGGDISFLHQKYLRPVQQALILVRCLDVKKRSSEDELRNWEMAPYIEAVDAQKDSLFMIKQWCKYLRVEWEESRGPTRERAFLLMDEIVSDIRQGSASVSERMDHFFSVDFPCLQVLSKRYANMLIGSGSVGEALKLFEELEMWHNLIDCHRLLGDKARAVSLIQEHLQLSPLDPRLWCSLGDATNDDACFVKSWEVSGGRFSRAQRCLARSAMNRKDYAAAVKHWDLALALNPLYPEGWFSTGYAALKNNQMNKALEAFVRTVQLDPENGEAFNNVAILNMRKGNYKEANIGFQQALKYKRNSWEIWDNYGKVSFELENYSQALNALAEVFELSPRSVDVVLLSHLVELVEEKKRDEGVDRNDREMKKIMDFLGGLLSKMASSGNYGGEIWGLKARWHKMTGDLAACTDALLRRVRAYQGCDWQHDQSRFRRFAQASIDLCKQYTEIGGKRELAAAQRHLMSSLKQAQEFSEMEEYKSLQTLLDEAENKASSLALSVL